ncbi:Arylsulfatase J [Armadillidium nasatum]|uniref:Arylsulfatase J n=1 Tax=Armadillidium nasatum TaxID=96803 RepID=A0A5N5SK69_9CRUS|nr:Arylsulfatase J [Armadillidium nasatum]
MDGMNVWNSIQRNSPSPRNEFVINIDPIPNQASIRVDDWKLLYNPVDLSNLDPKFNFWFGPSERDFPRNKNSSSKENDFKDVKNSLAGRTVQKLIPNIFKNIHKIRKNVEKRLQFYNSTAIPPGNQPEDPRGNPIFWNNTWINWFDYIDQNSYSFEV